MSGPLPSLPPCADTCSYDEMATGREIIYTSNGKVLSDKIITASIPTTIAARTSGTQMVCDSITVAGQQRCTPVSSGIGATGGLSGAGIVGVGVLVAAIILRNK